MIPNDDDATERIDDYIAGRLNETERQQFDERIRTDDRFRQEVALQRALIDQIRLRGEQELRQQMQQWRQEDDAAMPAIVLPFWRQNWYVYAIAASVAIILTVVGWFWWRTDRVEQSAKSADASDVHQFQLPIESTIQGLGYADDNRTTDSVWVQLRPQLSADPEYRFTDTLYLYTNRIQKNSQLRLSQEADSRYRLTVDDTLRYRLDQGFRQLQPLVP